MGEVILYASIASRSIAAYWMLEELGVSYRVVDVDLKEGKHKRPEYLAINPSGRVPAIALDGVVVTERPAICALLADRFGYGTLAPKIEAPDRGPYLKWLIYSTAVIDPAIAVYVSKPAQPLREMTWGSADHVVEILTDELAGKTWLLGEWFTAADVAIGAVIVMALYNNQLPENATLRAYNDRIMARPAFQRAADLTWPPALFHAPDDLDRGLRRTTLHASTDTPHAASARQLCAGRRRTVGIGKRGAMALRPAHCIESAPIGLPQLLRIEFKLREVAV